MSRESALHSFELDPTYREELDRYAPKQYSAELTDNFERAKKHRAKLRDDRPVVGHGVGRYVYPLPHHSYEDGPYDEYVLKLALPHDGPDGRDGREQNRNEARLWEETESEYLVPVVAADPRGYWLVMPRGEKLTDRPVTFDRWVEQARSALPDAISETEIEPRNVVELAGDYRFCDYGLA